MKIKTNTKNSTHFIYDKYGSLEAYMFTPKFKSKRKTLLTICSGKNKIDLNGRHVNILRRVLKAAEKLSSK